MGKSTLYGQLARYNASPIALVDGDAAALQVDSTGALKVASTVPSGGDIPKTGTIFGQPGRCTTAPVTLTDGQTVALRLDESGNVIVA